MYTLIRYGLQTRTLPSQIPSLGATLLIAEGYYKFHSFTLEFLAAVATWYVVDFILARVPGLSPKPVRARQNRSPEP